MPLFGLAKNSIPPDRLDVDYLSAISADIGTCTAGKIQNTAGSFYIDLDASKLYCNVAEGLQIDSDNGVKVSIGAGIQIEYGTQIGDSGAIKFIKTGQTYGFEIIVDGGTVADYFRIQKNTNYTHDARIAIYADYILIDSTSRLTLRAQDYIEFDNVPIVLEQHTSAPTPQEGMIAYADGTNWNPGSGEGIYAYYNGAWHYLG